MKMLFLGNSNDAGQWFEGGKKRHEIIAERLEKEFGEPVEVTIKSLWPNEKLPKMVEAWIEETEPDVIFVQTASFWFLYRSVPQRARRVFGKLGPTVGDAGFKVASSKRWSHNRAFRGARSVLQETFGGDTHFTPEEVAERISECVRIAVRREGTAVILKGPHNKAKYATTRVRLAQDEKKRMKVHLALKALCEQLHVPYEGTDAPAFGNKIYRRTVVGDGLHGNADRHEFEADTIYGWMRDALINAGHEPVRPGHEAATV